MCRVITLMFRVITLMFRVITLMFRVITLMFRVITLMFRVITLMFRVILKGIHRKTQDRALPARGHRGGPRQAQGPPLTPQNQKNPDFRGFSGGSRGRDPFFWHRAGPDIQNSGPNPEFGEFSAPKPQL